MFYKEIRNELLTTAGVSELSVAQRGYNAAFWVPSTQNAGVSELSVAQ